MVVQDWRFAAEVDEASADIRASMRARQDSSVMRGDLHGFRRVGLMHGMGMKQSDREFKVL